MAALITTRGLGRTQFALTTFGLGVFTLVPTESTGSAALIDGRDTLIAFEGRISGCVTVEIRNPSLEIHALSEQVVIDTVFADLDLETLVPGVEITTRAAKIVWTARSATITFQIVESDVEIAQIGPETAISVENAASNSAIRAGSVSTLVRSPSTTIDPGDCP